MDRFINRHFSRKEFLALLGAGAGGMLLGRVEPFFSGLSAASAGSTDPVLVQVILDGGPDFRHLIVPRPSQNTSDYGYHYWKYRAGVHGVGSANYTQWQNRYSQDYTEVSSHLNNNPPFGILKAAGWLIDQYNKGNVAFVSNVKHSDSRDHARSLLVYQSGDYDAPAYMSNINGWGGKLLGQLGTGANAISLTSQVLPFIQKDPAKIISFSNADDFGIYIPESTDMVRTNGQVATTASVSMYRALKSYYEAKGDPGGPYSKIYNHYVRWKELTASVKNRIAANPAPDAVQSLGSSGTPLNDRGFGRQVENLYRAYLCSDLLGMRVAALRYGGWDTHKWQQREIENRLEDMFGTGMAFDVLYSHMDALGHTVLSFGGDFGRQLRANGASSTDHGNGNYAILIGGRVNGGVYGEMWPAREIQADGSGKIPMEQFHQGIVGRNNFYDAYQSVVTWMGGTPSSVFAHGASSDLETGYGNLSTIVS